MPSSGEPGEASTGPIWTIEHHRELASTSDLVRARADGGAAEGLVVTADRQVAGRGRHGRAWQSPAGNLYLTLLLRPPVPVQAAGGLALVAGLSLVEACVELGVEPGRLRLKWPNDLVCGEAKVAGILLEAEGDPAGLAWVSIGIGVNVTDAPELEGRQTAALASMAPGVSAQSLRTRLLGRIGINYAAWLRHGMAAINPSWSRHALEAGTEILVKPGRAVLRGRYVGIDADGALLVDTGELCRVTTGEVLFAGEALAVPDGLA